MDTICANATAPGGALTVLRLSGEAALPAALRLWQGSSAPDRPANHRRLLMGSLHNTDGSLIDPQCLLVYMPTPHSYTGEDVVELQCHGGSLITRLALEALHQSGARAALPGEFTRRAFLNGKLDLTQAEAVAELISAESSAALSAASRQLNGLLGERIGRIYSQLGVILAELESHLDFPEEELEWIPTDELAQQLRQASAEIMALWETRRTGEILRHGISMVIAGAPNAGKSSLLNRWLGRERAIVSDIPGTTRDTVEADFVLQGIPVHLIDTAGIRQSGDPIEQCGIRRTREAVEQADIVLWLRDCTNDTAEGQWPQWPLRGTLIRIASKCDLLVQNAARTDEIAVCALSGEGLDRLESAVTAAVLAPAGLHSLAEATVTVNARHAALLKTAAEALDATCPLLCANEWELAAIPLRNAISACGEIIGKSPSPDILDTIFHRFCIGK